MIQLEQPNDIKILGKSKTSSDGIKIILFAMEHLNCYVIKNVAMVFSCQWTRSHLSTGMGLNLWDIDIKI